VQGDHQGEPPAIYFVLNTPKSAQEQLQFLTPFRHAENAWWLQARPSPP